MRYLALALLYIIPPPLQMLFSLNNRILCPSYYYINFHPIINCLRKYSGFIFNCFHFLLELFFDSFFCLLCHSDAEDLGISVVGLSENIMLPWDIISSLSKHKQKHLSGYRILNS